mgnify:FL=1
MCPLRTCSTSRTERRRKTEQRPSHRHGRFLILGSASPGLVGLASESLVVRVALVELGGFQADDVDTSKLDDLWFGAAWRAPTSPRATPLLSHDAMAIRYLDSLTDALVITQLQPWHVNLAKRQVRSPKVYVRDNAYFTDCSG